MNALTILTVLVLLTIAWPHNAAAEAIGKRLDTRISGNRISKKASSDQLATRPEDDRDKKAELQTAAKKKEEPKTTAETRAKSASRRRRQKKTRSVIASQ